MLGTSPCLQKDFVLPSEDEFLDHLRRLYPKAYRLSGRTDQSQALEKEWQEYQKLYKSKDYHSDDVSLSFLVHTHPLIRFR